MLNEDRLLLWVFVASDKRYSEVNHTYARTEIDARIQLQSWMAQQVALGRERIEVKHWPGGFRPGGATTYWPGSKPATHAEVNHVATTTTHQ